MPTKAELTEELHLIQEQKADMEEELAKTKEALGQLLAEKLSEQEGQKKPAPPKEERKVAIVGAARGSIDLTPDDDPSWEIWACSRAHQHLSRWDRWYEIHDLEYLRIAHADQCLGEDGYFAWLKKQETPIYMQEKFPFIPAAVRYPREQVMQKFPRYFESSIAWMTAHLLLEAPSTNVTTLGIYGVSMDVPDEYAHQRANMEWLLGIAHGMGIKLVVPAESRLLKGRRLYGFETLGNSDPGRHVISRRERMKKEVAQLEEAIQRARMNQAELKGAIQDIQWLEQNWL